MFSLLILLNNTPESVKSLDYATNLCQNLKEYNLIILNTTPYLDHLEKAYNMEIEDEAQTENAKLLEILSKYSFEYEFTQIEGEGSVGEIARTFMDKHDLTFDLILIGTKEKGKLEKYFIGSVSDYMMKGDVDQPNSESIPSGIIPILIKLISTPTDLLDTVLLALRCLTNLIEVLPNASLLIQQQKGIEIFLEKLNNLEFIDLAEQKYKYKDLEEFDMLDIAVKILEKKENIKMTAVVDMLSEFLPSLTPTGIWKISEEKEKECQKQNHPQFVNLLQTLSSIFSTCNTFSLRKKLLQLTCQIFQNCGPDDIKPHLPSITNTIYETFALKSSTQELLAIYYCIVLVLIAGEIDDQIFALLENEGISMLVRSKKEDLVKSFDEIQEKKEQQKNTEAEIKNLKEVIESDEDDIDDIEMSSSITELPKSRVIQKSANPEVSQEKEAVETNANIKEKVAEAAETMSKQSKSRLPQSKEIRLLSRIKILQKQTLPCNPIITSWAGEMILLEQLLIKMIALTDQCLTRCQSDNDDHQLHLESLLVSLQTLATEICPDEKQIAHTLENIKKIVLYESTNYQVFKSNFVPIIVDFISSPGANDGHILALPYLQTVYSIPLHSRIEIFKRVFDEDYKVLESITHEYISKTDVYEIRSSTEYKYEHISPAQINKHLRIVLKSGDKDGIYINVPALGSVRTLLSHLKLRKSKKYESDDEEVEMVVGNESNRLVGILDEISRQRHGNITGYNIFEQLNDVEMGNEDSDEDEGDSGEDADENLSGSRQEASQMETEGSKENLDVDMEKSFTAHADPIESSADVNDDHEKKPSEFTSEQSASTLREELQEKRHDTEQLYFSYESTPLSVGSTLFSVIYKALHGDLSKIWYKTHTIMYSKEKPESVDSIEFSKSKSSCDCSVCLSTLVNIPTDVTYAPKTFQSALLLLAVLDRLYKSSIFNAKLIAKVNRQLADPLLTVSALHPEWIWSLIYNYEFMFPFETRLKFFRTTHLGNSRNLTNWLEMHALGELTQVSVDRKKLTIDRNSIIATLEKMANLDNLKLPILEFEFVDEVGSGLGPTLEFYALVCKYFKTNPVATQLWKLDSSNNEEFDPTFGFYPKPLQNAENATSLFELLGTFCAKAVCDTRYLDLNFNLLFIQQVFEPVKKSNPNKLKNLEYVDPVLHASLVKLDKLFINDLDVFFTLPSDSNYHLVPNGDKIQVTNNNYQDYFNLVADAMVGSGVSCQIEAFQKGFNKVLSIGTLSPFTANEIHTIISGERQLQWTLPDLFAAIKADHGYTQNSRVFVTFCEMLVEFDLQEKREFLAFITGSPNLPLGGLKKLNPTLTIVCKTVMKSENPDLILPSVMTCAHYLKVPEYGNASIMKERFLFAMKEGKESFHLS
ncbi:Ubiquitin fusion degradation protein 4 [Terramyces sp. JEL0728]|nr:Ubiquitin fusion degradation protein 4 [Terramyces sp. JEL0728]